MNDPKRSSSAAYTSPPKIGRSAGKWGLAYFGGGAVAAAAGLAVFYTPRPAVPAPSVAVPAPSVVVPAPSVAVPAPSVVVPAPSVVVPAPSPAVPAPLAAVPAPSAEAAIRMPIVRAPHVRDWRGRIRRGRSALAQSSPASEPEIEGGGIEAGAMIGAGPGFEGFPAQLIPIGVREFTTHPESIPVLRKLVEYSKIDDQTGGFREARKHCGILYKCVTTAAGFAFLLRSGLRVDYRYDRALPYGQRNNFVVNTPLGERAEFRASPLVLDLDGRGIRTKARRTPYDIDGDGWLDRMHDLAAGTGLLVFDADGDGVFGRDGRELFGDRTVLEGGGRYEDGFEALWALAREAARRGVIPERALEERRLGPVELDRLSAVYGLRLRLGGLNGRTVTLREAGVTALALSDAPSRVTENFDGRGDAVSRREGASFERKDGSTGAYADVWFTARPELRSSPALASVR